MCDLRLGPLAWARRAYVELLYNRFHTSHTSHGLLVCTLVIVAIHVAGQVDHASVYGDPDFLLAQAGLRLQFSQDPAMKFGIKASLSSSLLLLCPPDVCPAVTPPQRPGQRPGLQCAS